MMNSRASMCAAFFSFLYILPVACAQKLYWVDSQGVRRANLDGSNAETMIPRQQHDPKSISVDSAAATIYWIDGNAIWRGNLDGSNRTLLVPDVWGGDGIALDPAHGKMYWADDVSYGVGRIRCADLDGSNVQDLVASGLQSPRGISLDVVSGKMYWADSGTDMIQRANLDGSAVEDVITTGLSSPEQVALDLTAGKLYWVDSGTDKIQRSTLQGTEIEDLVSEGLGGPDALVLDVDGGRMYWIDWVWDTVRCATLDGADVETVVEGGLTGPTSLAIDSHAGKLYWTDAFFNKTERADLDGLNRETLVHSVKPDRIALDAIGGKVYWTVPGSGFGLIPGRILRADLDGRNVEDLYIGMREAADLALDLRGGRMYWPNMTTGDLCCYGAIMGADLDGSNLETVFPPGHYGFFAPYRIALDEEGRWVYWIDASFSHGTIQRMHVDGWRVQDIYSAFVLDLDIDVAGRKLYWASTESFNETTIQRSDLTGTEIETLFTLPDTDVVEIALDPGGAKIYWLDWIDSTHSEISAVSFDGSQIERIVAADWIGGLALDLRVPGDYDANDKVDLRDFARFQQCFAGESSMRLSANCIFFDLDPRDGDVDLEDALGAQLAWTGP